MSKKIIDELNQKLPGDVLQELKEIRSIFMKEGVKLLNNYDPSFDITARKNNKSKNISY